MVSIYQNLVDRPQELFAHCLKKISIDNSADLMEIVVIDHRLFSTLSHKCEDFADEDNMRQSIQEWTK